MLQVGWFKYTKRRYGTGRRLLRMAPLHHHFELLGWAESRVVLRFYIAGVLLGFGTSAGYHRLARTERTQRIMQRMDHSTIFVLIAGTYTPICLLAMPLGVDHRVLPNNHRRAPPSQRPG